MWESSKSWSRS